VNVEDLPSSEEEGDENLEVALKLIKQRKNYKHAYGNQSDSSQCYGAHVIEWPEVVEDFVRNYLMKMGMLATLDCFQVEWYRLKESGQLQDLSNHSLPDVYHQNRQLIKQIELLKEDVDKYKGAALCAKNQFVKLKKERDYHRMHHRRVFQEKEKVLKDIKRLKSLSFHHKEVLEKARQKFENAAREKTIAQVDNERLRQTCKLLQSACEEGSLNPLSGTGQTVREVLGSEREVSHTSQSKENKEKIAVATPKSNELPVVATGNKSTTVTKEGTPSGVSREGTLATVAKEDELATVAKEDKVVTAAKKDKPEAVAKKGSLHLIGKVIKTGSGHASERTGVVVPFDMANPYQCMDAPHSTHLNKEGGWQVARCIQAHSCAISGLCLHPRKLAFVTGSDDHEWKMWSLPECEILMSGSGHKDWVGGVQISPNGFMLGSSSGDGLVKLWDFRKGLCVSTLQDHQQPVWDCSWHSGGDYLATASMDHTVKLWDVERGQCVSTLRGHADSVNSVEFLVYSNTLCTSSADKTISLWDVRTSLCLQTFFGHSNSCNSASPTLKGDIVASCDSFGHVFLWDLRGSNALLARDLGPHSVNKAAFDPSGELVGLASNDGTVKLMNIISGTVDGLCGHEDQVQSVVFAVDGTFALSSSTSGQVIVWQ
jgi:WD40 repeat protein